MHQTITATRAAGLTLFVTLLLGCPQQAAETPTGDTSNTKERTTTTVAEPDKKPEPNEKPEPTKKTEAPQKPPAEKTETPVAEKNAVNAYREFVARHERRDVEGYFRFVADELVCFHGVKNYPKKQLMAARTVPDGDQRVFPEAVWLTVASLEEHKSKDKDVVLVDIGVSTSRDGFPMVHEKAVLMTNTDAGWRLRGEAPVKSGACLGPLGEGINNDQKTAECRSLAAKCSTRCGGACRTPSNSCETCKQECLDDTRDCLGVERQVAAE